MFFVLFVLGHHWAFAKINIEHITLLDTFGGRKYPNVAEYFKAVPNLKHLPKFRKSRIIFEENVIIDDEF